MLTFHAVHANAILTVAGGQDLVLAKCASMSIHDIENMRIYVLILANLPTRPGCTHLVKQRQRDVEEIRTPDNDTADERPTGTDTRP